MSPDDMQRKLLEQYTNEAKDDLRNGALFGDTHTMLVMTCYNSGLLPDAITNATTELRRFFCYDLPLQERWKGWQTRTATLPRPPLSPTTILSPVPLPPNQTLTRKAAKEQGYEGSPCTTCGGMRVKRNGACLLCEECQTSSGCS